ncbi:sensor histidine kinase [Enhygromyxa salina]|uniref:Sensor histidine kinase YpdA n=1 Tax=Enhygromyxa salina TaxID=215803 RepID=A0A2S9XZP7_9BACT|nr:histidine kinase [Enhygromyxa salina]PRP98334.1 Sensor histidine kinase YpdA [Enhygromyxa salina]
MRAQKHSARRRIATFAILDIAVFLALDVYFATTLYIGALRNNPDASWADQFFAHMPAWAVLAAFAPGIFWLSKHQRMGLGRGVRPVLIQVGVSLAWMLLVCSAWILIDVARQPADARQLEDIVSFRLVMTLFDYQWYWLIVAAAHVHHGTRDAIARATEAATLELEKTELERRLARSELDALKAQLHPHFLFNTHHAIAGLIRSGEPDAALELIADLSGMLRYALETEQRPTVPLARELEFTRRFLAIQAVRFKGRLEIEWDVSAACGPVPVPPLILQPLIENAVHHGVSSERTDNFVRVRGHVVGDALELEICNSMAADTEDRAGFGVGLRNVHARLQHLYGDAYTLELELVSASPTPGSSPHQIRLHMILPSNPRAQLRVRPDPARERDKPADDPDHANATYPNAAGG